MTTAQNFHGNTITVGQTVRHTRDGWTAIVTSIYPAPGYGCLHAGLRFDVGESVCSIDMLIDVQQEAITEYGRLARAC